MKKVQLGRSGLHVTPVCLGTVTFGEQVDEPTAHAVLDRSLARGINLIDTAEMYSVPARAATFGAVALLARREPEQISDLLDTEAKLATLTHQNQCPLGLRAIEPTAPRSSQRRGNRPTSS